MKIKEIVSLKESRLMHDGSRVRFIEEISEKEIVRLVRYAIFEREVETATEEDLYRYCIETTKCDLWHAKCVMQRMRDLGLGLLTIAFSHYKIIGFAVMRGYITSEELAALAKKKMEREEELQEEAKRVERKKKWDQSFLEKYGSDPKKWSEEMLDEYEKGLEECQK